MNHDRIDRITCDICGSGVMDYRNEGITRHPCCEPGWKPEPIPVLKFTHKNCQRSIQFYTKSMGVSVWVGDSHIDYLGHVGKWEFGETRIYYRPECPLCKDWNYEPWDDNDCPLCNNDERVNVIRWLWIRLQISRVNDWRQMFWHYVTTGEKVW